MVVIHGISVIFGDNIKIISLQKESGQYALKSSIVFTFFISNFYKIELFDILKEKCQGEYF